MFILQEFCKGKINTSTNNYIKHQMVMIFAHDGCQKNEDSLNAIKLWGCMENTWKKCGDRNVKDICNK